MATLLGNKPKDTFPLLLKFGESGDGTELRFIEDGNGVSAPLKMSSTTLELSGVLWPTNAAPVGGVMVVGANNAASWVRSNLLYGLEENQKLTSSGPTLALPAFVNGFNYEVTLSRATQITLPSVADVVSGSVLAITVKIKQTEDFAVTWNGNGKTITFDDPDYSAIGANKTAIFSFIYYGGNADWLGGLIWKQV